jgi:hypothetical protein
VTAAEVRVTMKLTFCVCYVYVLVREQIVVYHLLQSVPVVELAFESKHFVPVLFSELWLRKTSYEHERQVRYRVDGGSSYLSNIVTCIPDYTALYPRGVYCTVTHFCVV